MNEQLDILAAIDRAKARSAPDLRGLVHRNGLHTERSSAAAVLPHRGVIQQAVLECFKRRGRMTAEECEQLAEFEEYGPSTVRKRISELKQLGELVADGTAPNSRGRPMTVWRAA